MHLYCLSYLAWQDPQTWSQGLEISPFVVFCPSLTIDLQSTSIQHFKGGGGGDDDVVKAHLQVLNQN